MNKVIGRDHEQKLLIEALSSHRSELIAVYGRRRVGKTFLIRQTYKKHIQFELSGIHNGNLRDQLLNFYHTLSDKGAQVPKPSNWLEAFFQLGKYLDSLSSKKKKVIFIDEFPWLATRKSKFLMAFENFWNSYASKRDDLVLVICGSAAAYMVKNIIRNKGGLHNRITQKIRLLPFNLNETSQFLRSRNIQYSSYDILLLYMAIGGIPHYLDKLQKGESVPQAIDRLCFIKDAPLKTEFKDLFASLFDNYNRHNAIIRTLAKVRKGLTRNNLSAQSKIPTGGRLTRTLEELEESGFIEKYLAFKNTKKDALYRLNDEYSMFYLKFIEKSTTKGKGTWIAQFKTSSYKSWLGFSFETVCLKHVDQLKSALGIAAVHSENYSWIEKNLENGAQIDLLIDRADQVINLCEMKFYNTDFAISKQYAQEIKNKAITFQTSTLTRKNIFVTMITTYGIKQNQYSLELVQNDLTMDCLFKDG